MGWHFSFFPVASYEEFRGGGVFQDGANWNEISNFELRILGLSELCDDGLNLFEMLGVNPLQGNPDYKYETVSVEHLERTLEAISRMTETQPRNVEADRKERLHDFVKRALDHARENGLTEMGFWGG